MNSLNRLTKDEERQLIQEKISNLREQKKKVEELIERFSGMIDNRPIARTKSGRPKRVTTIRSRDLLEKNLAEVVYNFNNACKNVGDQLPWKTFLKSIATGAMATRQQIRREFVKREWATLHGQGTNRYPYYLERTINCPETYEPSSEQVAATA
jgi:hypothetical protein